MWWEASAMRQKRKTINNLYPFFFFFFFTHGENIQDCCCFGPRVNKRTISVHCSGAVGGFVPVRSAQTWEPSSSSSSSSAAAEARLRPAVPRLSDPDRSDPLPLSPVACLRAKLSRNSRREPRRGWELRSDCMHVKTELRSVWSQRAIRGCFTRHAATVWSVISVRADTSHLTDAVYPRGRASSVLLSSASVWHVETDVLLWCKHTAVITLNGTRQI